MSPIRTFINELHTWEWLAILLARLAVGLLFFLSGRGKLFVPERREQMRQTLLGAHVPFPDFNTILVSMVEFVFGSFLVLGFATPLACVMLGGVMIVAIPTTAVKNIKATSPPSWLFLPLLIYETQQAGVLFLDYCKILCQNRSWAKN